MRNPTSVLGVPKDFDKNIQCSITVKIATRELRIIFVVTTVIIKHNKRLEPLTFLDLCGKEFSDRATLQKHTLVHSTNKPHQW